MATVFSHLMGMNPSRFLASLRSWKLLTFISTVDSRATFLTAWTTVWLSRATCRDSSSRQATTPPTARALASAPAVTTISTSARLGIDP